ncbi:hypothetical protein NLU13_8688 [Sarocladium strictum]|uniref:Mediator of RNA polymerase II transcription subunit 9 n=1 Tax=Sarocladium strictum TaxID=5046 RepID=A0AA39L589_SARSR|nr:hypothetical protein NLU13_8688 [Sarocladium strictum]
MADATTKTASPPTLTLLPPSFSPDSLDVLTSLAHDLARVRAGLLLQAAASDPNPSSQSHQQQPGPAQPLAIKDVPGATDAIKHKLQRARAVVKGLPDMGRGLDEQEREVRELEERIERQRGVLLGLRERGERRGDGEEKMEM